MLLGALHGPLWLAGGVGGAGSGLIAAAAAAACGAARRQALAPLLLRGAASAAGPPRPAPAEGEQPREEPSAAPGPGPGRPSTRSQRAAALAAETTAAGTPLPLVHLTVNGRRVAVPRGSTLLEAAAAAKVSVPTLCKLPGRNTPGSCRICMVEVNGVHKPACCTPVVDGTFVSTDTPSVREYVRGTLALMRANHPEDCMTCDANGRCEFQGLIAKFKVPMLPKLAPRSPDYREAAGHYEAHDVSSPAIEIDREKCIKCGRCVETCQDVQRMNVLGWFSRGRERHIGFMCDSDMSVSACISCGQCVSVCPVGALSEATHWRSVMDLLSSKRKIMVAQTAPAVRVAIGEELGLAPGAVSTGQLVAGLRALGFDYVFDTDFSADLTILEEGTELLGRLQRGAGAGPLPLMTSCCPAWVNLVEQEYPEFIGNLSSCKSPQQMLGAVIKEVWAPKAGIDPADVVVVSVMPCTAKKGEAARPEMASETAGGRHVDYVLTTRELGRMFRLNRIPGTLPPEPYDTPMGVGTGAAVLFGNSGGVTEAAVRTVYEVATGKPLPRLDFEELRGLQGIKQATVSLPPAAPGGAGTDVRIAVVNGIANARKLLNAFREGTAPPLDFIEVMTCPGGCIGGGGQPKSKDTAILSKRMQAVYGIDVSAPLRKSHENPEVMALYESSLGQPNSHEAHGLLHTTYRDRSRAGQGA